MRSLLGYNRPLTYRAWAIAASPPAPGRQDPRGSHACTSPSLMGGSRWGGSSSDVASRRGHIPGPSICAAARGANAAAPATSSVGMHAHGFRVIMQQLCAICCYVAGLTLCASIHGSASEGVRLWRSWWDALAAFKFELKLSWVVFRLLSPSGRQLTLPVKPRAPA